MPPKVSNPIVIPAMSGIDGKFTCIGSGLLYDGHARESPDSLRMLLAPTGNGEAIGDRARSKSWWFGQCYFYGLQCSKTATIPTIRALLESALRSNSLQLPKTIKDLENKSNREFKKLNKEVWEKTSGAAGSSKPAAPTKAKVEKKAAILPKTTAVKKSAPAPKPLKDNKPIKALPKAKVVKEKPAAKSAIPSIPVAKSKPNATGRTLPLGKGQVKRPAAEALGGASPHKKPRAPAKVKAGPNAAAPAFFVKDEDTNADTYEEYDGGYEESDGGGYEGFLSSDYDVDEPYDDPYEDSAGPSDYRGPPPTDPAAGYWDIECPYIVDGWPIQDGLSMNLVRTHGNQHIEGDFQMGLVSGFLRSTKMEGRADGGVYVTFEYVGEELDGPIVPPNRTQKGYLRFTKDGARGGMPSLKGGFSGFEVCDAPTVEFTGRWIRPAGKNEHRWDDFDEEAYERARVSRW